MKKFVLLVLLIGVLIALTACDNTIKNEVNETNIEKTKIKENLEEETFVNSELEGIEKYSKEYIEEKFYNSDFHVSRSTLYCEWRELKEQGYDDNECRYILLGRYGLR